MARLRERDELIIHQVVDRLHVRRSRRAVCRAVWDSLSEQGRSRAGRTWRREAYRAALAHHAHNGRVYRHVMGGIK